MPGALHRSGGCIVGWLRRIAAADRCAGHERKSLACCIVISGSHKFGRHSNPLHDHGGALPKAGLVEVDGTLYGTTEAGGYRDNGTVYSISTTGKRKLLYNFRGQNYGDGSEPTDDLTTLHGTLYGTTIQGGTCNEGTVYSISTNGREHVLYTFCNTDYAKPTAGVVRVNDTFYGTNVSDDTWGGEYSLTSQGVFNRLYVFRGPYYGDGTKPKGVC